MLETIDEITKKRLRIFSLFTATLLVMSLVLTGFTFLAKKSWNKKLRIQIEKVLEQSRPLDFPDKFKMGKPVKINSTAAVSSNIYEVVSSSGKTEYYALITRITTFYGPQAVVFLYDKEQGVSFEGFACLNSRVLKQLENKETDLSVKFWTEQAKKIFENSVYNDGVNDE